MSKRVLVGGLAFLVIAMFLSIGIAKANHSWGGYHWARMANPFTLKVGDNVSSAWDQYLATASVDWSASAILDTTVVPGQSNPKNCRPTNGRIEVCNSKYGNNGWLGIAQIWASGTHITQAVTKLNDTYFATAKYNTPAWRQFVVCQEVGHTFGLDHQDETFGNANLGTCMDYTDDPDGVVKGQLSNLHPNQHDYDELASIYAHLDSFSTVSLLPTQSVQSMKNGADGANAAEWGKSLRTDSRGRTLLYARDIGGNERLFTFVIWAE